MNRTSFVSIALGIAVKTKKRLNVAGNTNQPRLAA